MHDGVFSRAVRIRREPEKLIAQQLVPMLHTLNVDYTLEDFNIHEFTDAIQSRIISNQHLPPRQTPNGRNKL
jgi:hypothetical protein